MVYWLVRNADMVDTRQEGSNMHRVYRASRVFGHLALQISLQESQQLFNISV